MANSYKIGVCIKSVIENGIRPETHPKSNIGKIEDNERKQKYVKRRCFFQK